MDIPQVSGWHRWLFDSNDGPPFVQKPNVVFLFKYLNRNAEKLFIRECNKQNITFMIY